MPRDWHQWVMKHHHRVQEFMRTKYISRAFEEEHLLTFAADSFHVVVAGLHRAFLWMLWRGERKAGSLWGLLSMLRGWMVVRMLA